MNLILKDKIIAFIPARGGSEGCKDKNIKLFNGKPLIYYSIEFARKCGLGDSTYVSTDDLKIAEIASGYGAKVIKRPDELATAKSTVSEAALHFLEKSGNISSDADYLLVLQPTNPLRTLAHFEDALRLIIESEADCVFTVTPLKAKLGELVNGFFKPTFFEFHQQRQDLGDFFSMNGLIFLSKISSLLKYRSIFGEKSVPIIVGEMYTLADIDTPLDFEVTEFLYKNSTLKFRTTPCLFG